MWNNFFLVSCIFVSIFPFQRILSLHLRRIPSADRWWSFSSVLFHPFSSRGSILVRILLFVHVPLVCASAALRAASRFTWRCIGACSAALDQARRSYILTWQLVLRRMLLSLVVRTHARFARLRGCPRAHGSLYIGAEQRSGRLPLAASPRPVKAASQKSQVHTS